MNNNKPYRNYPNQRSGGAPFTRKPLTEYQPGLAFQRLYFYLDVLEAHFAALGVVLESARKEGRTAIPNPSHANREEEEEVDASGA